MPTPHGSRGGMAFSADELRVLRRALAEALHPTLPTAAPPNERIGWAEDIQDYVRLAESVEEAVREGGRMRAFLLADLRRYRDALPGAASGFLARLRDAMEDGYLPGPEDLAALRSLRSLPCSPAEHRRRAELLRRASELAESQVRARLEGRPRRPAVIQTAKVLAGAGVRKSAALDVLIPAPPAAPDLAPANADGGTRPTPSKPEEPAQPGLKPEPARPRREEAPSRREKPQEGGPQRSAPGRGTPDKGTPGTDAPEKQPRRRTPTPAELWPPHRRGQPSAPGKPSQRLGTRGTPVPVEPAPSRRAVGEREAARPQGEESGWGAQKAGADGPAPLPAFPPPSPLAPAAGPHSPLGGPGCSSLLPARPAPPQRRAEPRAAAQDTRPVRLPAAVHGSRLCGPDRQPEDPQTFTAARAG